LELTERCGIGLAFFLLRYAEVGARQAGDSAAHHTKAAAGFVSWSGAGYTPFLDDIEARLAEFAADGLIELGADGCRVTAEGRGFLRNICMAFDARLARRSPERQLFSRTA